MTRFDIITIFPGIFDSYFDHSIIKRARAKDLVDIRVHDLRDHTEDKHRKVDDTPYGGGAGMVMKPEPVYNCLKAMIPNFELRISHKEKEPKDHDSARVILFSAKGKRYTQADAERLMKYDNLVLICGRYEGVDERVAEYMVDEEISIGDYVLTGGEIPAMILVDSITRLIPGVLGNPGSLQEESFNGIQNSVLEYPQYTKPEIFHGWKVPEVLLGGDHAKVDEWRKEHSKKIKD